MCTHIIRVTYFAPGEPPQLVPLDSEEAMLKRLAEFQSLETVSGVTVFDRGKKYTRKTIWEDA